MVFTPYLWSFISSDHNVGCTTAKEDDQVTIHLAKNPETAPNSKHVGVRHHFVREHVANGELGVEYVSSAWQHAHFLTKALAHGGFPF